MKLCHKCGTQKPLSDFYKNKISKDGLQTQCKKCHENYEKIGKSTQEGLIKNRLRKARCRAKARGLECTVTLEELIEIAPKYCPVFGYELLWNNSDKTTKFKSPSLDRKNSDFGYTKENVQWLSWRANKIKNDLTKEEARQFANWVLGRPENQKI